MLRMEKLTATSAAQLSKRFTSQFFLWHFNQLVCVAFTFRSIVICSLLSRTSLSVVVTVGFNTSLFPLFTNYAYHLHNYVERSLPFKVAVDTLTMNIFIRQNIGRGITFKILIGSAHATGVHERISCLTHEMQTLRKARVLCQKHRKRKT